MTLTIANRLLLLLALALIGCSLPSYESALLLQDIAAGDAPTSLKAKVPAPARQPVFYQVEGRQYLADLYLPIDPVALMMLMPGVAEAGKDDPRLVAFATSLGRAGFLVLVPDLPQLRALKVQSADVQSVIDAFRFLTGRRADLPAGIGAFSYGVGPALLAAMRPEIASDVKFVLGVGGYYDLREVITFFTTGYFRQGGRWRYLEPNAYGKWIFALSNIDYLPSPMDRQRLSMVILRQLGQPDAPVETPPGLTEGGRALLELLTNEEPERVPLLIDALPASVRREIAALNVAGKELDRLQASLILLHGYGDDIIPYTQSEKLARAVGAQAHLFLVQGLSHVDVEPGLLGTWRLWRAVDLLLEQRQR